MARAFVRSFWIEETWNDVVMPFSYFFFSASRFRSASSRDFLAAAIERSAVSTSRAAPRTSTQRFCLRRARFVRESSRSEEAMATLFFAVWLKIGTEKTRPTVQVG